MLIAVVFVVGVDLLVGSVSRLVRGYGPLARGHIENIINLFSASRAQGSALRPWLTFAPRSTYWGLYFYC